MSKVRISGVWPAIDLKTAIKGQKCLRGSESLVAIVATIEVAAGLKWKISMRESCQGGRPHWCLKMAQRAVVAVRNDKQNAVDGGDCGDASSGDLYRSTTNREAVTIE